MGLPASAAAALPVYTGPACIPKPITASAVTARPPGAVRSRATGWTEIGSPVPIGWPGYAMVVLLAASYPLESNLAHHAVTPGETLRVVVTQPGSASVGSTGFRMAACTDVTYTSRKRTSLALRVIKLRRASTSSPMRIENSSSAAGAPDKVAVLVSVELCSLTRKHHPAMPTLVAGALFGDGAAAR